MQGAGYFNAETGGIDELVALTGRVLDPALLTYADSVERNVPIYDIPALDAVLGDVRQRKVARPTADAASSQRNLDLVNHERI